MGKCHVALFRGINVGHAKRVAMKDLRTLLTSLGYEDVRTLRSSGNVVFTAPRGARGAPGPRIEAAMTERLGVTANVTVLDAAEVETIAAENPLGRLADDPSRLLVSVPRRAADLARFAPLAREDWAPDALAVGSRAAYLWCADGILASRLVAAAERALGERVTTRNWGTFSKLREMVDA